MSREVAAEDLHRAKQVVRSVREHGPVRDAELAAAIGCDLAELRVAVGIAFQWRRVDRCGDWLVAVPSRAEGRRAA